MTPVESMPKSVLYCPALPRNVSPDNRIVQCILDFYQVHNVRINVDQSSSSYSAYIYLMYVYKSSP
jgi:hypothetical protein